MQRAWCRTWIELSGEWKMRKFYLDLLLKRGCTLKGPSRKCVGTLRQCAWFTRLALNAARTESPLIINPKLKKHPLLKDFQILARDTVNGTYLFLQIGNIKVLCIYFPPPSLKNWTLGSTKLFWNAEPTLLMTLLSSETSTPAAVNGLTTGITRKELNWRIGWNRTNWNVLIPALPTYVTARGNSIVDHVFTNVPGVNGVTSDPIANIAGHRPITGSINITAKQNIPEVKYERILLENLKDEDTRDRLNARLSVTIGPFRARLRNRRKVKFTNLWTAPKSRISPMNLTTCSPNASCPQRRKSSEVRRQGRGRLHMKNPQVLSSRF